MDKKDLYNKIILAVGEFIEAEEAYDDNAQLEIDPATWNVALVGFEDAEPEGMDMVANVSDGKDYYDVMDLVRMNPDEPGQWLPDEEAINSVSEEYFK